MYRLRAFPASITRVSLGKSSKFHKLGLRRLQAQRKLCQPFKQGCLNSMGIRPILEAQHKIVDVPHQISFALQTGLNQTVQTTGQAHNAGASFSIIKR
jgi:hypothetical protein